MIRITSLDKKSFAISLAKFVIINNITQPKLLRSPRKFSTSFD